MLLRMTGPESAAPEAVASPRRRGRPADAEIDERVLAAGVKLFAEVGWKAFNLDGVAREARVGKAALYRRWPTREALITDALERIVVPDLDFDTGSLRGDLLALGGYIWQVSLSTTGSMLMRVAVEAHLEPGIFGPRLAEIVGQQTELGRAIVRRAVARGEVPAEVSSRLVIQAMSGAIQNRVLYTSPEQLAELDQQRDEVLDQVVDFVIAGMRGSVRS
jgi:AcrR family transcriptional regulator